MVGKEKKESQKRADWGRKGNKRRDKAGKNKKRSFFSFKAFIE